MSTIIHFVRHGQVNNPDNIAYGRMPGFHLSSEGKEKAAKVGAYFRDSPISVIYTSPLERTFETANIISDSFQKLPKVIHKYELIEIDAKKWQSFKLEELFQDKYFESFVSDPESREVPENLNDLARRLEKFTKGLCSKHKEQEIICVSHEYPILALRLQLEGKSLTQLRNLSVDTASITTFVLDANCILLETSYTELQ